MSNPWLDATSSVNVEGVFVYNQKWSNDAWIAALVPCAEDGQERYFYGPDVLNVRIFTTLSVLDYYPLDELMDDVHVKRLGDTFDTFASYKTFVVLDEAIKTDANKEDFEKFDLQLKGICEKLATLGFVYLGVLDSSKLNLEEFLNQLIHDYYTQL